MKTTRTEISIFGMTCDGCANSVKRKLESISGVQQVNVLLKSNTSDLEFDSDKISLEEILGLFNSSQNKYSASKEKIKSNFWNDFSIWKDAGKNTLNCLIGCSIGDFGMMTYLQIYHPKFPVLTGMVLAMISGLFTSVILETILLKIKNGFSLKESFKTALSMSFLSMLAMELTENLTDYTLTGGSIPPTHHFFWTALLLSMVAGFSVPLPYNYYKLKKFGRACH